MVGGIEDMILSKETAAKLVQELKLQGKKVVFTNGCFDILHELTVLFFQEFQSESVHQK